MPKPAAELSSKISREGRDALILRYNAGDDINEIASAAWLEYPDARTTNEVLGRWLRRHGAMRGKTTPGQKVTRGPKRNVAWDADAVARLGAMYEQGAKWSLIVGEAGMMHPGQVIMMEALRSKLKSVGFERRRPEGKTKPSGVRVYPAEAIDMVERMWRGGEPRAAVAEALSDMMGREIGPDRIYNIVMRYGFTRDAEFPAVDGGRKTAASVRGGVLIQDRMLREFKNYSMAPKMKDRVNHVAPGTHAVPAGGYWMGR